MYDIMIRFSHILKNVYHKNSQHLSPCVQIFSSCHENSLSNFQICNTVLLTIATMLCITSPWLIYFITGSLYLLIPFTHFRLVIARGRRWGVPYAKFSVKFLSSEGPPWNIKMFLEILEQVSLCMYQVGTDWLGAFLPGPQTFNRLIHLVAREYSTGGPIRFFFSLPLTPNPCHGWTHLSSSFCWWDFSCGCVPLDPLVPMRIMEAIIMVTWEVSYYTVQDVFFSLFLVPAQIEVGQYSLFILAISWPYHPC